ncbi:MAG: hypothetical protein H5U19_01635 [Rhodobacteraceae bacterium]|nr:hypothetical protein [Paracoccaceae bacterium]
MNEITELEHRIAAALERIGAGLDAIGSAGSAAKAPDGAKDASGDEVARLREALEAERAANAQLNERVRAIRERQETTVAGLERKLERMTRQLDAQGIELQRMKKAGIGLREAQRALREAHEAGLSEPHLINKSMLAELESLRAARQAEAVEIAEILEELSPLIREDINA